MSLTGFTIPTFQQILANTIADLNSNIPGSDANLPYTVVNAHAYTVSAAVSELYNAINYAANQTSPLYATGSNLDGWALVWGLNRKTATVATGFLTASGTVGTTVSTGVIFQTASSIQYVVTAATTFTTTTASIPVSAVIAGSAGNQASSTLVTLTSSVAGLQSQASVGSAGLTGGTDQETDAELLARILARTALAPQGGCANDYVNWSLAYAGVTRAWCSPQELGSGTVTVRFCMDDLYASTGGIPLATDVANLATYINTLRPVTANVTVVAPLPNQINITITGLQYSTDLATVTTNIQANLYDLILNDGSPAGTIRWSRVNEAISSAVGVIYFEVQSPMTDIVCTTGYLPVLGTITYA